MAKSDKAAELLGKISAAVRNIIMPPADSFKRPDGTTWLSVRNEANADYAEMVIEGAIGENWYDNSGTTSKQFRNALAAIPKNRPVKVTINSEGGSVGDALAIYNVIKERGNVETYVDGYALSSASVIACAGAKCLMPKSSILMIHEPWTYTLSDEAGHLKAAEMLATHGEIGRASCRERVCAYV